MKLTAGEEGIPDGTPAPLLSDTPAPETKPESYTFGKIKQGDVEVDAPAATVAQVTEFAKANGLSQAQAQAFLDRELQNPKPEIPETYSFEKVKNEKGEEIEVAKEISDPVAAFAKENGLTQAQAQKLLNRELNLNVEAEAAYVKGQNEMITNWQAEVKADPILNKDGKLAENLGKAKLALTEFFPGLAASVKDHYFLDHPVVLKGLLDIAQKVMPDGKFVPPGSPSSSGKSFEEVMYPSMFKK